MDDRLQIFQQTYQFVDAKLDTFLDDRAGAMIAEISGPLRAALVLYVLLYGFAILRGAISEPVLDFAVRSIKLSLIFLLASTPAYSSFVGDALLHGLPDSLARAVSGAAAPDVGAAFDAFFSRAAYLAEKIAEEANFQNPLPWLLSACVFVIGALAAAMGFGVVMIAKVALAMLVSLGPIFIACALFDASRRFFFGWLAQAVNYVVLFGLIIVIFQLVLSLVDQQWGQIDGQDPIAGGLIFIALCCLGMIFFLQTPAIAAGIAGGASVGLSDFANAITPKASASRRNGPQEAERAPPSSGADRRPASGATA
ncbi:MAG: type IV secretion system protein [Phenylobacterium sp.]|uniref:type IV secretion system protein n=1 Tax=Phenylobacterium sp. TaxID=1871053 RepID=UPI00272F01E9|nr:type IV secretion system protein [Phenylobacterium sp.]MDP2011544.1 type IV secretion system protein [Phenylobacterium sp.]